MLFEQVEMVEHDTRRKRLLHPDVVELLVEALAEIARRHSRRIESLHALEHPLDDGGLGLELGRQVFDRRFQVAVVVEVVDDGRADDLIVVLQRGHPKLPHQMLFK
jgi:hypothetical protein